MAGETKTALDAKSAMVTAQKLIDSIPNEKAKLLALAEEFDNCKAKVAAYTELPNGTAIVAEYTAESAKLTAAAALL